ncbi:MAG: hypothetical protein Q7R81_04160 [Candidatus Peregrinibacteria bacterium]|nr:hypothetical protein [Candidatus Peregrinibacteria bacterium]
MLRRFHVARIASHHSPTREQRELPFAKSRDDGQESAEGGSLKFPSPVQSGIARAREEMGPVIPSAILQDLALVIDSEEIAEAVGFDARTRARVIARELGGKTLVAESFQKSDAEIEALPPESDKKKAALKVFNPERRSYAQSLSIRDLITKLAGDDNPELAEKITGRLKEERAKYLERYLQTPDHTLTLLRSVTQRQDEYENLVQRLERKAQGLLGAEKPNLAAKFVNKLRGRKTAWEEFRTQMRGNRNLALLFMEGDLNLDTLDLTHLNESEGVEVKRALKVNLVDRWAISRALKLDTIITDPAKHDEMLNYIMDALQIAKREGNFGLAQSDVEAKDPSTKHKSYLDTLTDRKRKLESLLRAQLKHRAEAVLKHDVQLLATAYRDLGIPRGSTDEGTNRAALTKHGYSCSALFDVFESRRQRANTVLEHATEDRAKVAQSDVTLSTLEFDTECLQTLEDETIARNGGTALDRIVEEAREDQRKAEQWAWETVRKIAKVNALKNAYGDGATALLRKYLGQDADPWTILDGLSSEFQAYAAIDGSEESLAKVREQGKAILATEFTREKREMISKMLTSLADTDTESLIERERLQKNLSREGAEKEEILQRCDHNDVYLTEATAALLPGGEFSPSLKHSVTQLLRVDDAIQKRASWIVGRLSDARLALNPNTPPPVPSITVARAYLLEAEQAIIDMRRAAKQLQNFPPLEGPWQEKVQWETAEAVMQGREGYYDYATGTIHIRANLRGSDQGRLTYEHERGHAILDVLKRRSRVLPQILLGEQWPFAFEQLAEGEDASDTLLAELESVYGIDQQRDAIRKEAERRCKGHPELVTNVYNEMIRDALRDEFINRYDTYKRGGLYGPFRREEQLLFDRLDRREQQGQEEVDKVAKPFFENLGDAGKNAFDLKLALSHHPHKNGDSDDKQKEGKDEDTSTSSTEAINAKQELLNIQGGLETMKAFMDGYKQQAHFVLPHYDVAQKDYDILNYIFIRRETPPGADFTKDYHGQNVLPPEQDPGYKKAIVALAKNVTKVTKVIGEFRNAKRDTSKEQKSMAGDFWSLFEGMKPMSLLDFAQLWKNTWEDVQSIYKRRQDRLLGEVGGVLTDALTVGKNIPLMGNYLYGLKQYHKRRYSGAELEAVEKWEKALENDDSHSVLEMIPGSNNKDQIRGILSLLSKRGELEWNDLGLWEKLSELSRFQMPYDACKYDDVLRDTWLRKMITEIWEDKELYYQWRSHNDSKISSGKKEFTDTADQLSNIQGGMASDLEMQLRLHTEWEHDRKNGIHREIPVDVKAHRYEELIEYAIRNGKMSMEEKFYYIVQGVRHGLLSIDRLRVLAGEKGGILMKFPFIDYFYQKNNSFAEVERLGKSLQEKGPGMEFKPGIKTTLWLHLEVARNEEVQKRVNKAKDRFAEGIDHEDIPFMITQLDFKDIGNLANVISGSRQKVTTEGWKNAYVGFNSRLQILGHLLTLDEEGIERFTETDAVQLAQMLTSYIHMDNILTENGSDFTNRPSMTEYQLSTVCPSGGHLPANKYRHNMTEFLGDLFAQDKLGSAIHLTEGVTVQNYVPGEPFRKNDPDLSKKVFRQTEQFVRDLTTVLKTKPGRDKLREVLKAHTEKFDFEGAKKLEYKDVFNAAQARSPIK